MQSKCSDCVRLSFSPGVIQIMNCVSGHTSYALLLVFIVYSISCVSFLDGDMSFSLRAKYGSRSRSNFQPGILPSRMKILHVFQSIVSLGLYVSQCPNICCRTLVDPCLAIKVYCISILFLVIFANGLGAWTDIVRMRSLEKCLQRKRL